MEWTYLNESFFKKKEVKISPFDRGFLFGDGVYEVIPVYKGRVFLLDDHISRLERSLQETGINKPKAWDQVPKIIDELIKKNRLPNQVVYLQISRGNEFHRSHIPTKTLKSTLFISSSKLEVNPYKLHPNKPGLKVKTIEDTRGLRCDVKSVTLLSNIMALREARSEEKDEVIFHREGNITEGAASNVFVVIDNLVKTPPLSKKILSGVTRKYVIYLLKSKNISFSEEEINIKDLFLADEVWMTSSTKEIQPVAKVNNKDLKSIPPKDSLWSNVLSSYI